MYKKRTLTVITDSEEDDVIQQETMPVTGGDGRGGRKQDAKEKGRGIRNSFAAADDVRLIEAVHDVDPVAAAHGQKAKRWDEVAAHVRSLGTPFATARNCQKRYEVILENKTERRTLEAAPTTGDRARDVFARDLKHRGEITKAVTAAAEEVERRENSAKRLMKFANTAPSVMQQAKTAVRKNNNKTASSDAAERRDEALDADDEFEDKGDMESETDPRTIATNALMGATIERATELSKLVPATSKQTEPASKPGSSRKPMKQLPTKSLSGMAALQSLVATHDETARLALAQKEQRHKELMALKSEKLEFQFQALNAKFEDSQRQMMTMVMGIVGSLSAIAGRDLLPPTALQLQGGTATVPSRSAVSTTFPSQPGVDRDGGEGEVTQFDAE